MPRLPGVNHLDALRAFEKIGFRVLRQGKHIVMTDGSRSLAHGFQATELGEAARDLRSLIDELSVESSRDVDPA